MSTENLHDNEGIEKLREMVDKIDIGMLCTYSDHNDGYVHAVPMSRQEVDEEGNIWYICSTESDTYRHLEQNKKVSVLFAHVGNYRFLSVNGEAEISHDPERIERYWNKFVAGWFDRGKEDPRIRILKVRPVDAHYWDNDGNKLITFFKMATKAATGQKMDVGKHGDIDLSPGAV